MHVKIKLKCNVVVSHVKDFNSIQYVKLKQDMKEKTANKLKQKTKNKNKGSLTYKLP